MPADGTSSRPIMVSMTREGGSHVPKNYKLYINEVGCGVELVQGGLARRKRAIALHLSGLKRSNCNGKLKRIIFKPKDRSRDYNVTFRDTKDYAAFMNGVEPLWRKIRATQKDLAARRANQPLDRFGRPAPLAAPKLPPKPQKAPKGPRGHLVGGGASQRISNDVDVSLPYGWSAKVDHASGKTYYQNDITRTTQWERPAVQRENSLSGEDADLQRAIMESVREQEALNPSADAARTPGGKGGRGRKKGKRGGNKRKAPSESPKVEGGDSGQSARELRAKRRLNRNADPEVSTSPKAPSAKKDDAQPSPKKRKVTQEPSLKDFCDSLNIAPKFVKALDDNGIDSVATMRLLSREELNQVLGGSAIGAVAKIQKYFQTHPEAEAEANASSALSSPIPPSSSPPAFEDADMKDDAEPQGSAFGSGSGEAASSSSSSSSSAFGGGANHSSPPPPPPSATSDYALPHTTIVRARTGGVSSASRKAWNAVPQREKHLSRYPERVMSTKRRVRKEDKVARGYAPRIEKKKNAAVLKAEQDLAYEEALQKDLDRKHAEEARRLEEERAARAKAEEAERCQLEAQRKAEEAKRRQERLKLLVPAQPEAGGTPIVTVVVKLPGSSDDIKRKFSTGDSMEGLMAWVATSESLRGVGASQPGFLLATRLPRREFQSKLLDEDRDDADEEMARATLAASGVTGSIRLFFEPLKEEDENDMEDNEE